MRARISLIAVAISILATPLCLGQTQNGSQGQRYTPQQLQEMQRRAAQAAPQADPVAPSRQRQATPEEMQQMRDSISRQQSQRNNPMAAPGANYQPKLPQGFPLPPEESKFVSDVLDWWQKSSSTIKRSTCGFTRRSYDPGECSVRDSRNNHLFPFQIALGELYFAAPDRGRFETSETWKFKAPPAQAGQEPQLEMLDMQTSKERWICDGRAIYNYDFYQKRLMEAKIPPEFQGNGLVNSPLPFFLFGADKQLILDRYWVRHVTPANDQTSIWLEAYPKRVEDARIYKKLEIIIARDDFLPSSLVMFASNYDAKANPVKQTFTFDNRRINSHLDGIKDFFTQFRRPGTPAGWKRVDLSTSVVGQTSQDSEPNNLRR